MDYRESFTVPESSNQFLKEFRLASNSVEGFCSEILPQCRWDLLPGKDFLFELYKSWHFRYHAKGSNYVGYNTFIKGVIQIIKI